MQVKGYKIPEVIQMSKKPAEKEVLVEEFPISITVGFENRGNKVKQTTQARFSKKGKKVTCEDTGKEYASLEEAVGMSAHKMIVSLMSK